MRHTVLAPNLSSAANLARAVHDAGWFARLTRRGRHHVVLVHAPASVLKRAIASEQFIPGEQRRFV